LKEKKACKSTRKLEKEEEASLHLIITDQLTKHTLTLFSGLKIKEKKLQES